MLSRSGVFHAMATIVAVLTLASCAGPRPSYSGRSSPESVPLVIDVENLNWWDIEVELEAEGTQFRLGVAPSYGRARFGVSASLLGGASFFRVIANPMDTGREAFSRFTGQGVLVTPVIELFDHRSVRWTVGSSETTTNLIVR